MGLVQSPLSFGVISLLPLTLRLSSSPWLTLQAPVPPQVMALQKSDAEVDYGTSADVYSVGMVIYEMLSGLTPYHDSQKLQIALKVFHGPYPTGRNPCRIPEA
jgi:serine/threonine protein kinase